MQRRNLIRNTYMKHIPDSVTVKFIVGKSEALDQSALQEENDLYRDILYLPIPENMNQGKTFHYFHKIYTSFFNDPFKFVMKVDEDVFVHLLNLKHKVQSLPEVSTYFGREVTGKNFLAGLGYILSWDLVEWISEGDYAKYHQGLLIDNRQWAKRIKL